MKVATILKRKGTHVETISPDATVYSAVWNLKLKDIGALVVTGEGGTVQGILSERDIVGALAQHGQQVLGLPVGRVMSAPVVTCAAEDSITDVMARMTRRRVRHLPVVDGEGRLGGIVSIGDVVKHRLDELELEANVLRETLIASH